ncbi:AraC family transcriptional regulator [Stutzerimonas sp. R40042]|mgnify:FL=1|uniref:AraC family transcriptional regulator n=1 Tax=Stutzerimonas frequens TaxID=2968969 RepID=A0AA47HX22_9GAMM|nr:MULTISPECIES: AraC family transcriptional regulator [Stutzerimonas]WAE50760.1 AraC family transcriptional regulator [Stutzerimonas frequens]WAE60318.1 AraC family transcriptional regulator [Stutzerimonas sp. R40042]
MSERTTSSSWAQGIVQALESAGVDCRQLFTELGLDYAALNDADARFAQDDMTRLWQRAVEVSGNPAIGLDMARQARPAALNVVGYALMSSRNLQDGFARLVRYQRIIAEGADLDFQPCAQGYRLSLTIHGDRLPPARQSAEGSLAGCLTFCRWLTGTALRPLEVSFQGPAPDDLEPYRQLFQAPLRFGAARYALLFRQADVEAPLPTANEALAQLHDRFAGEYLSRFVDTRVMHQARQMLCRMLPQGEPRRETVAQALCLSERTLQRRLQEEGSSFQKLLDDTRRDLAVQYLCQPDLAPLAIAYLLGFADPSNFYRAFKRWFGVTPGEYRLALRGHA